MLAVGILLISSTVAINLLLEDSPVVIQLEGDTFKVVDIPYVYTVKEAYILLFSGFFWRSGAGSGFAVHGGSRL
ncbi:hypothetical protein [Methanosarcina barkeri]|uniref:hypothetical protein n=1 Tax=Methanosarcina barkeri TaxID=2208 RepID=UPI000A3F00CC|nr:hypothetical protein [Methanosarcina barkeri]